MPLYKVAVLALTVPSLREHLKDRPDHMTIRDVLYECAREDTDDKNAKYAARFVISVMTGDTRIFSTEMMKLAVAAWDDEHFAVWRSARNSYT